MSFTVVTALLLDAVCLQNLFKILDSTKTASRINAVTTSVKLHWLSGF